MFKTDWIETYSGRKFHLPEIDPDEIYIEDIAHSLSLLCRFTGHCKQFYSVAQHSIFVSSCLMIEDKLAGLLHDAPEAYTGDLSRPWKGIIKQALPEYKEWEDELQEAIYRKFGITNPDLRAIKAADNYALAVEAHTIMDNYEGWDIEDLLNSTKLPVTLTNMSMREAEREFLSRFEGGTYEINNCSL